MKTEMVAFTISFAAYLAIAFFSTIAKPFSASEHLVAGRRLNKYLVGISAAATGNSGFIMTGMVGLGYLGGTMWLFLPVSWLIGDILFWKIFPMRINDLARKNRSFTLTEMLAHTATGRIKTAIIALTSVIIFVLTGIYTASQWLAGGKVLSVFLDLSLDAGIVVTGAIVIAYCAIGGLRSSVNTDVFQAALVVTVTVMALIAVTSNYESWGVIADRLRAVDPALVNPFAKFTAISFAGFVLGFAAASLGFSLGQPQVIVRYFAGLTPEETRAAWWIYIGYLHFTWVGMTLFGILVRGIMPGLSDGEIALAAFFNSGFPPIISGIVLAGIFACIASTADSVLLAVTNVITHDLPVLFGFKRLETRFTLLLATVFVGTATILIAIFVDGSVFQISLFAISLVGASLAPAVMIRLLGWHCTPLSIFLTIALGFVAALIWRVAGYNNVLNEAAIGIATGLLVNFGFSRFGR